MFLVWTFCLPYTQRRQSIEAMESLRYIIVRGIYDARTPFRVDEEIFTFSHINVFDLLSALHASQYASRSKKLESVTQTDLDPMLGNFLKGRIGNRKAFGSCTQPNDGLHFFGAVGEGRDDE